MSSVTAWGLAAVVAVTLPQPAAAQAHPDFSGHWTLAQQRGAAASDHTELGSGWGPGFTVIQRSDTLLVEREFFSPGDLEPPMRFRYAMDGAETVNTVMMGRGVQTQTAHAHWEGERLVISVVYGDPEAGSRGVTSEVRYTLWYRAAPRAAHPPLLVIETWRGGAEGGAPTTTRTVYVRS
jgi:hypothetical protein